MALVDIQVADINYPRRLDALAAHRYWIYRPESRLSELFLHPEAPIHTRLGMLRSKAPFWFSPPPALTPSGKLYVW